MFEDSDRSLGASEKEYGYLGFELSVTEATSAVESYCNALDCIVYIELRDRAF